MKIKNYTSKVPFTKSVSMIEKCLIDMGANHINKTYQDSILVGITFQIIQEGFPIIIKLPANIEAITKEMLLEIKKKKSGESKKNEEKIVLKISDQAVRTAWKLLLDWTQVQSSMVIIGKRKVLEMFLPYIYDSQKDITIYEKLEATKFKMLNYKEG